MGSPGRREIGHGKLAWRAIHPMLPTADEFPYTIRVVSEITESNGSSSMATVCGTSLALMDAGVPLKRPVAGIAMGLILEGERFAVLSDILGDEDHLGDMDFKVAGTDDGVTSLQMDIKIAGITEEIMKVALGQAKDGRLHILGEMAKALHRRRAELGEFAPRIETIKIPTDKIREVIGTGGKVIREIVEKTGAKINIEDDGTVKVASSRRQGDQGGASTGSSRSPPSRKSAQIYEGTVVKTVDFGAFVNFFGAKDGLVHISQLADRARRQDHRRRQGRRQGLGQAPGLRRARQGPPVDEGRRPGDRRGPREEAGRAPEGDARRVTGAAPAFVVLEGGREAALFVGDARGPDAGPAIRIAPPGLPRALTPSPPLSPQPPPCHPILRRTTLSSAPSSPLSVIPGLTRILAHSPRAEIPALRCAPAGMTQSGGA